MILTDLNTIAYDLALIDQAKQIRLAQRAVDSVGSLEQKQVQVNAEQLKTSNSDIERALSNARGNQAASKTANIKSVHHTSASSPTNSSQAKKQNVSHNVSHGAVIRPVRDTSASSPTNSSQAKKQNVSHEKTTQSAHGGTKDEPQNNNGPGWR